MYEYWLLYILYIYIVLLFLFDLNIELNVDTETKEEVHSELNLQITEATNVVEINLCPS